MGLVSGAQSTKQRFLPITGHANVRRNKGYNPADALTLKSGCSQENNIPKSEVWLSLRETALNPEITAANSLLK